MAENGSRSEREQTLAALRQAEKFVVVTHENPDGDALGSLIAMQEILQTLGKDALMFIDEYELPLPQEYRFLQLHGHVSSPPEDLDQRTLVFLDCGNIERNRAAEAVHRPGVQILNIDHHHDNTRFGTVNLVDPHSSCTAEIVWDLMHGLGVELSQTTAEAMYVGLITDTGRFMYENTGPRAHVMAAELIEAGVDVHEMYRRVYEGVPYGKLALLARGLTNIQRFDDGRLTLTALSAEDFLESDAEESYSEGVVDHLRAVEGTLVAALVRERLCPNGSPTTRKVSLRSSDGRVDVSAIAREVGGGGHRQAAGFTTEMDSEQIVTFLRGAVAEQLAAA
jgi:bifunctional oligoribonuclease and PAP phosphatase NrnA